jgi:DNA-binding winged helix-turn-helix (wHTH) protein
MQEQPFLSLAQRILQDLAGGNCVAVTGLSNTGKTTLMRGLASPQAARQYRKAAGREPALVLVDCNRAVAMTPQAFYEIVLRSLLEYLTHAGPPELAASVREYHFSVTEADNAFQASLSFNLALTDVCAGLAKDLCLLIDEFDELYMTLDDRALLNLRALRDRFPRQLMFVTATLRSLSSLRGVVLEDEFAEMFSRSTYSMEPLTQDEGLALLRNLSLTGLTPSKESAAWTISGGHPGLLMAAALALSEEAEPFGPSPEEVVIRHPAARAECLKIWNQLAAKEQSDLAALAAGPVGGLPQQLDSLDGLGLVAGGRAASPLLAAFIRHRGRAAEGAAAGIQIDPDSGEVMVDGLRVPVLTDLEFKLLQLFDERRDKLTDKYAIVTRVWGESFLDEIDDARVEKLVSRLRGKIESDPANPRYLTTVRGRGYKLLSSPHPTSSPPK